MDQIQEISVNDSTAGVPIEKTKSQGGFAAMMGVSKAVKAFNKFKTKKPKVEVHSAKKDAFLLDAVARGDLNLTKKFITESGCSPNLKNPEGKSLVQLALEGGHDSVVMYLFLEHKAVVTAAKGLHIKEHSADCFHISLIKTCVEKTTDRDKAFQVACEALAHSSNPILSALLLAEMYGQVSRRQPTHRHTLDQNREIMEKMAIGMLDNTSEDDVMMIVGGEDPSFGKLSPITVAIRSHNSSFISHPFTQDYIAQIWKGDDPLQRAFLKDEKSSSIFWDFIKKPKKFFGSPRGHFFLHIYTYLIFIGIHMQVTIRLGEKLGNSEYITHTNSTDGTTTTSYQPSELNVDSWEHLFSILTICSFINELEKLYRQGWAKYTEFFWNYADVSLFVLLLTSMVFRYDLIEVDQIYIRNIMGLSSIPLYIRLLELLVLSRRFGPLMIIIQNVLSEVLYFLLLALLMIVAFAQSVTLMFNDPGRKLPFFSSVSHSCITLFIAMLGVMDESQIDKMRDEYIAMGPFVMILYLLITSIILLNLLIAILSNIYKKIDEKSNEEWMFLWGSTVMRLQKEVKNTIPAPLNIILKLLMVFPRAISEQIMFVVLMFTAYVPGFLIGFGLYTPFKLLNLLLLLINPNNYKAGGGNPFKGAAIAAMDQGHDETEHSPHNVARAKNSLQQFWVDNFTDNDLQMRGREGAEYAYDSKSRGTIADLEVLKGKDQEAYQIKLGEMRDEIKDLLSVSSSNTSSLVADVLQEQDQHSRLFDEQGEMLRKMKSQMLQLEKLIHITNRNLNALSKAEDKHWKKLESNSTAGPTAIAASTATSIIAEPQISSQQEDEVPKKPQEFSGPQEVLIGQGEPQK
eukprot:CAMPEP_0118653476 /NCGR_PEP_ID=MMETSP0785-20121206/11849_1 /TAXON_ID=91992 /ORGANISM="Bolidomonas pacifica, Strain CCMP 1866" /LENGTH=854 /DNA_ID=CAMNT_0006546017 /DNA_START=263 /DNA_END=2828 /DNA_ORIENTATION=-